MADEFGLDNADLIASAVVDMSRRIREKATEGGKEGPSRDASYQAAAAVVGHALASGQLTTFERELQWSLGDPNVHAMTESA